MNAQHQDALRILSARGPMTSRALFDIMQDELGYYGFAANKDQVQLAVESLSKILSKMKSDNIIDGNMTAQPKGRPVMVWSARYTEKSDGEMYAESSERHANHEVVEMAKNIIGNLTSPGYIAGIDDIPEDENPEDDDHISQEAEMVSDIAELSDDDGLIAYQQGEVAAMRIIDNSKRIETYNGIEILEMTARAEIDGCYLRGETVIRNKAQLAQFIGAIERMLP